MTAWHIKQEYDACMAFLERSFANVGGKRCAFHRVGTGEPLVLIHGWGQSADMWQSVIPCLSLRFRVYALDLPGFGWSEIPDQVWGINDFVHWMHTFIVQHGLKETTVLGHSFGGRVAYAYAAIYGTKRLILYNSSDLRTFSLLRTLNSLAVATFGRLAPKLLWSFHTTMLKPHSYQNRVSLTRVETMRMLAIFVRSHNKSLQSSALPRTTSMLCMTGMRDRIVDPKNAARYAAEFPYTTQVTLDGGHFAHLRDPGTFCRVVEQFCTLKSFRMWD